MSGASMKQIRTRIRSVESTRQITRAMELVATSKLRRARTRVECARPYHEVLGEAIVSLQAGFAEHPNVYSTARAVKKTCYVVIAGDRGLAGGYHANLFRMVEGLSVQGDCCILPIGRKALEQFQRRNVELVSRYFDLTAAIGVGDCNQIAALLCRGFETGAFDRVEVVYTQFCSMLSQVPVSTPLLPLQLAGTGAPRYAGALLEGEAETLIARIVPQYVAGVLYAAVCEAAASEHAARRTAMNAANKNADALIDTLLLRFNRARQAVITQEITEIVGGAEAL